MRKTTKNVNWDRDLKANNDLFKIITKKSDRLFKGEDAKALAILQARALARYFPGGRHLVYRMSEKEFEVVFDECIERVGVADDSIFSASSSSNSGTFSWCEARTFSYFTDV